MVVVGVIVVVLVVGVTVVVVAGASVDVDTIYKCERDNSVYIVCIIYHDSVDFSVSSFVSDSNIPQSVLLSIRTYKSSVTMETLHESPTWFPTLPTI